jgi:hypothetical protein
MEANPISELATYIELISNGGILVLLLVGIWAFMSGKVFPKTYVEEMKKHSEDQVKLFANQIVEKLENGFSEATEKAIVAAVEQLETPTHLRKRDVQRVLKEKE